MNHWQRVDEELEKWDEHLLPARLWLRDDDAVDTTGPLKQLVQLIGQFDVPVALAVIPHFASRALAERVAATPHVCVALHGHAHTNHAPPGQKKCELGLHRDMQVVLDELTNGRAKLEQMFGERFINLLVPPWNRIDPQLVGKLASTGLAGFSTYGWDCFPEISGVTQLNTHVDIIDWRGTRGGRPASDLVDELAIALATARKLGGDPVGILSHHLIHDEAAWEFLRQLFHFSHQHRRIEWCHAASLSGVSSG